LRRDDGRADGFVKNGSPAIDRDSSRGRACQLYLAQFADLRTEAGHAAVVRNGHHPAATPDLWRDGHDRRRLIGILMLVFKNHPNRAGADLGRKPVCSVTFFP
jgi:hypothetical protein